MARIRTIKPDFFLHEELAELSALHRLLFVGLWTLADKEGRLEDRPKRIKAALFPWDNCDIHEMLEDLDEAGLIHRYEGDVGCIAIPSFKKHQRPHPKEPASTLPAPPSREKKRQEIKVESSIPSSPVGREGKESWEGKEFKEGVSAQPPAPSFFPAKPEKPAKDDDAWDGLDFWAWAQAKREEEGLATERRPNERAVSAWWSAVRMSGFSTKAMRLAFVAFGNDPYWSHGDRAPPIPFGAFLKRWQDFARQEAA